MIMSEHMPYTNLSDMSLYILNFKLYTNNQQYSF